MEKFLIKYGVHHEDYIEASENIIIINLGDEIFKFQIHHPEDETKLYKSFYITPHTNFKYVDKWILYELELAMYYYGEGDDEKSIEIKRSLTRTHIQNFLAGRTNNANTR
jgi:hypothetical protein